MIVDAISWFVVFLASTAGTYVSRTHLLRVMSEERRRVRRHETVWCPVHFPVSSPRVADETGFGPFSAPIDKLSHGAISRVAPPIWRSEEIGDLPCCRAGSGRTRALVLKSVLNVCQSGIWLRVFLFGVSVFVAALSFEGSGFYMFSSVLLLVSMFILWVYPLDWHARNKCNSHQIPMQNMPLTFPRCRDIFVVSRLLISVRGRFVVES